MNLEQGFVAGTLVHTNTGLVPIEQIKVGDMVLSKPESGDGELAYAPVVNTFEFDDKEVWYVEFRNSPCYDEEKIYSGEIPYHSEFIIETPDYPFGVIGKLDRSRGSSNAKIKLYPQPYWSRLDELTIDTIVLLANGIMSVVESIQPVSVMANPQHGFLQGHNQYQWWTEDSGSYIDFSEYIPVPKIYHQRFDSFFNKDMQDNTSDWGYKPKTQKVYNFEVADYHTYFVGRRGIWVKSN